MSKKAPICLDKNHISVANINVTLIVFFTISPTMCSRYLKSSLQHSHIKLG